MPIINYLSRFQYADRNMTLWWRWRQQFCSRLFLYLNPSKMIVCGSWEWRFHLWLKLTYLHPPPPFWWVSAHRVTHSKQPTTKTELKAPEIEQQRFLSSSSSRSDRVFELLSFFGAWSFFFIVGVHTKAFFLPPPLFLPENKICEIPPFPVFFFSTSLKETLLLHLSIWRS